MEAGIRCRVNRGVDVRREQRPASGLVPAGALPGLHPASGRQRSCSALPLAEVAAYYANKTAAILRRYGPGPRVHYHTGLMDEIEPRSESAAVLRRQLVAAQERSLYYAAEVWQAAVNLSGEVLDVGCGLGGGAIFWAQEFAANVTAVTCVPDHARLVAELAARAGVAARVHPLVADALELQGHDYFDGVVAVDSSCHLPRRAWFRQLFGLLRRGGRVFVSDCFLGRQKHPQYEDSFNRYWHARIGTIPTYLAAAHEAGLQVSGIEDLSRRAANFWAVTVALIQAETRGAAADLTTAAPSIAAHTHLRQGLLDGDYQYALLSFAKSR
jgi:tocopherol O-methyltransferase